LSHVVNGVSFSFYTSRNFSYRSFAPRTTLANGKTKLGQALNSGLLLLVARTAPAATVTALEVARGLASARVLPTTTTTMTPNRLVTSPEAAPPLLEGSSGLDLRQGHGALARPLDQPQHQPQQQHHLLFGAPQRQRPASAGAGRNAVRDVRSERRGSNGSTGGNANGSNGGLSGATTAPAANAQHQVPGQGSNARKPANKAMGVRSKLVGDQVAVYQEFAALLADFDGHDMVQLLEAALSDAQELTGLGDFYATNATPTTTTAAVEETAQGAAQSANAKAIPPVQTGGAQGESAA